MVNKEKREEIGIALLGVAGGVSMWAASNSSIFALRNFTKTETDIENARKGMNIGLFLTSILGLGIWMGYGKKGVIPALLTVGTGIGFYAYYEKTLREFEEKISNGEV